MITLNDLEPKYKNFTGQLQINETVKKKNLISGAVCPYQGPLNAITLR
jgi:hypothetical protein